MKYSFVRAKVDTAKIEQRSPDPVQVEAKASTPIAVSTMPETPKVKKSKPGRRPGSCDPPKGSDDAEQEHVRPVDD